MSYISVSDHRSMALDRARNQAYSEALRGLITPNSTVLDLGAGTGILGLIAARLGARRVYLVEPEDVIAVAEEIVVANGLQSVVRCVQGRIQDLELPERVDIIVSVLTGNFLVTEDLLSALFHARDHVLEPGGALVPSAAIMEAVPVSAPAAHAKEVSSWSALQQGVELGAARPYAANRIFYRADGLRDAVFLAEPKRLKTIDFLRDNDTSVHADVTYEVTRSGACHGWIGWFDMKLGEQWLSTSPRAEPTHWSPAFLPLDPPIPLSKGERISFTLDRPVSGEWSWKVRSQALEQRHSTMLAAPMKAATLKKASSNYRPLLTPPGHILYEILSMCNGATTVDNIVTVLCTRHPDQFRTRAEALDSVRSVIKRYA